MPDVTAVRHVHDYVLWIQLSDGTEGKVDLRADLWGEVFEPLRDVEMFRQVRLNRETGTIEWPNGADVAPEHLSELLRASGV